MNQPSVKPSPTTIAEPKSAEGAAFVSLLGNKKIAGVVKYDHQLGMPMVRVEVPATSTEAAFVRFYHTQTIIHVQPCTEAQMQAAAEYLKETMFPSYLQDAQATK